MVPGLRLEGSDDSSRPTPLGSLRVGGRDERLLGGARSDDTISVPLARGDAFGGPYRVPEISITGSATDVKTPMGESP
jgi:hypothetical protein